jgi:DNA-binding transcriptional LysR family regulator
MFDVVEYRHLRYVVAVAETRNFTRASERLFLAQPSLSQQIRDLEDKVGFPIFYRTRGGVTVTPAGEVIVRFAREALRDRSSTFEVASAVHNGQIPALRLGFSSFVHPNLIQSVRSLHAELFPGCGLQLASGSPASIMDQVEQGKLDCAIALLPVVPDRFRTVMLSRHPLAVCMRGDDPLVSKSSVSVREVAERLTIHRDPSAHPLAHARLLQMFHDHGVSLHVVCSAATPHDAYSMVRSGCGLAMIETGFPLDADLVSKPMLDVDWTADTAFTYATTASHIALRFMDEALQLRSKKQVQGSPGQQLKLLA